VLLLGVTIIGRGQRDSLIDRVHEVFERLYILLLLYIVIIYLFLYSQLNQLRLNLTHLVEYALLAAEQGLLPLDRTPSDLLDQ
jgi:hypothetical protein